jgi:hypothetical protein
MIIISTEYGYVTDLVILIFSLLQEMTTFNVETQNLETTDPSIGSNVTRAPRRNRSSVWNHFTPDPNLFHTQHVALNMREKYDKYWGGYEKLNMLLLISFVLDPRQKMVYANWFIEKNFAKLEADALKKKLDLSLKAIFEEYNNSVGGGVGGSQGESEPTKSNRQIGNPSYYYGQFMQSTLQSTGVANSSGFKSELIKYFNDGLEEDSPNFDILNYWKVHSSRLPVLANIARDLLAIPVSTVASESAFSTGGRVLDEYRSRLSTNTVEALICTEDCLGGSPTPLPSQEDMEDLEKIERGKVTLILKICFMSLKNAIVSLTKSN